MSQEDVEIVRRHYEAVERAFEAYWANPRSVEEAWKAGEVAPEGAAMARYVHPNVEWKTALTGVTYRGYANIAKGWDELLEAARDYGVSLKEVTDLGKGRVLAVVEAAIKGKSSEIAAQALIFTLVTVRDGQITRLDEYVERSEALGAAGLSPEDVGPEERAMAGLPVSTEVKTSLDQGFACWNGGEIDLMADHYADDAEVDTKPGLPDGRCYKGREQFVKYFHEQWHAWAGFRIEPLNIVGAGRRRYVVEVRMTGTGRSSGIEIDQRVGLLYTLREQDGKVARVQMFPNRKAALEAAGYSESPAASRAAAGSEKKRT